MHDLTATPEEAFRSSVEASSGPLGAWCMQRRRREPSLLLTVGTQAFPEPYSRKRTAAIIGRERCMRDFSDRRSYSDISVQHFFLQTYVKHEQPPDDECVEQGFSAG